MENQAGSRTELQGIIWKLKIKLRRIEKSIEGIGKPEKCLSLALFSDLILF